MLCFRNYRQSGGGRQGKQARREKNGGSAWESNPPTARFTYGSTVLKTAATTRCASTSNPDAMVTPWPLPVQGSRPLLPRKTPRSNRGFSTILQVFPLCRGRQEEMAFCARWAPRPGRSGSFSQVTFPVDYRSCDDSCCRKQTAPDRCPGPDGRRAGTLTLTATSRQNFFHSATPRPSRSSPSIPACHRR